MRRLGALLLICLLVATGLATISDPSPARAVIATVLVNDSFTGAVIADPAVRATGSTCLTGAVQGSTPPPGVSPIGGCPAGLAGPIPPLGTQPGYLLLTDAANNRAGNLFYNRPIPSSAGIEAQFEIYMYGGSGADGITFFLVDGATELTATGGLGGSLGYAQRNAEPGVLGGYVGIGFDVYGNFYDDGEGRGHGCPTGQQSPSSQSGAIAPNTVVVRGPGANITGYCYMASTTNPASNPNRPTSTLPGRTRGHHVGQREAHRQPRHHAGAVAHHHGADRLQRRGRLPQRDRSDPCAAEPTADLQVRLLRIHRRQHRRAPRAQRAGRHRLPSARARTW